MRFACRWRPLAALLLAGQAAMAINIDISSVDSIKAAASQAAYDMMTSYTGNETGQIPGKLPGTWWVGGAMFMTIMQYWHWTGDDTYNAETIQGMVWQAGEYNDFMTANYSSYLGNDDQIFWGLAAMTAAELNFPAQNGSASWLSMAQGVFNNQLTRWDTAACNGGLRWQIYPYQAGYADKNAISNGGLFQLSARLARYTNNQTYADWAEKIWDWSASVPILNTNSTPWDIADLVTVSSNCQSSSNIQWSYNYGTYLSGVAYMYNMTNGAQLWKERLDNLLTPTFTTFFPAKYGNNIMSDISCETNENCDGNMVCYKGFLSAWLAFTSLIAPYTSPQILPKLQASAQAAAKVCTGPPDGSVCGVSWVKGSYDGFPGIGQQMSVVSVFASNLIAFQPEKAPLTAATGGTSQSDPTSGLGGPSTDLEPQQMKINTADRAGAGILTAIFVSAWVGMIGWLVIGR